MREKLSGMAKKSIILLAAALVMSSCSSPATQKDIYRTAIEGDLEKLKPLLQERRSDPAVGAADLGVALVGASCYARKKTIFYLLEAGADINAMLPEELSRGIYNGYTPLHCAAFFGHTDLVHFLLENGAKINKTSAKEWETPLGVAAAQGKKETVDLLLEREAEVSVENSAARQLAHAAAEHEWPDVMSMLIERRFDLPALGGKSNDYLLMAVRRGNVEVTRVLLDAEVYEMNPDLLLRSASSSQVATSKMLLDAGYPVNAADFQKSTALHIAAIHGDVDYVRFLVEHGADPGAVNRKGKTPLDIAREQKRTKVESYLSSLSQ